MNKFFLIAFFFLSLRSFAATIPAAELAHDVALIGQAVASHPLKCAAILSTPGYFGDAPDAISQYLPNVFNNLSDDLVPNSNSSYEGDVNTNADQTVWVIKYYDHYYDASQVFWVVKSKDNKSVIQVLIDTQDCSSKSAGTPFCKELSLLECK